MNPVHILRAVAETDFRPFTDSDYQTFGNVSPASRPLIGEWGEHMIIISGVEVRMVFCPDLSAPEEIGPCILGWAPGVDVQNPYRRQVGEPGCVHGAPGGLTGGAR
jgi:hypothetical protein